VEEAARLTSLPCARYDHIFSLAELDEADLDAMNITLPGHRKRFLLNGTLPHSVAAFAPCTAPNR
jgi:hypothetical protein